MLADYSYQIQDNRLLTVDAKLKKIIVFLLLFAFQTSFLWATDTVNYLNDIRRIKTELNHSQDSIRLKAMLQMAEYYGPNQPDSIKYWSDKSLLLALQLKKQTAIAKSYFHLGNYYNFKENVNEALGSYYKALEVYEEIQTAPGLIATYNNIGNIYKRQNNNEKALEFYLKSFALNKSISSTNLAATLNNIGNIYMQKGKLQDALSYYLQAKEEYSKHDAPNGLATTLLNLGLIEDLQERPQEALVFYTKALEIFTLQNNAPGKVATHSKMGLSYIKLNRWVSANKQLNKAMNLAKILDHLEWQMKINQYKGELYTLKGDYKNALHFYQIHYRLHDSIFTHEKSQQLAQLETKYETQQKNRKIEQLEEQEKITRFKWYALILGTGLIVLFTSILLLKQQKQIKRDKEIITKNKEIHKAQKDLLAAKLEYKGNELQNFAIHIIQKNDFLHSIKINLSKINKFATDKNRDLLKKINIQIQQNLQLGKDIEVFHKKISRMNENFFQQLSDKFPTLTEKEKKLCALLKLNFSSKEIASLNNISERAVVMARYRLRKKMQIPSEEKLSDYLNKV